HDASCSLIYPLSLHDALPIFIWPKGLNLMPSLFMTLLLKITAMRLCGECSIQPVPGPCTNCSFTVLVSQVLFWPMSGKICWYLKDRKSTRLNSSHVKISYAVF